MTTIRRLCVVAGGLAALALAPRAEAICAVPPSLERRLADARIVFVGVVVELEHRRRTATFRVEEVWKGRVGRTVTVHGGPTDDYAASSVERKYAAGVRYLVVPYRSRRDVVLDNMCSATRRYKPSLDQLRPADAVVIPPQRLDPPRPDSAPLALPETNGTGRWLVVGLVLSGAALAAGLAGGLVRGRTRFRRG